MNYRVTARDIFDYALQAVLPGKLIRDAVALEKNRLIIYDEIYDLSAYNNIYVLGSGKASIGMAEGIYALLTDKIKGGCVVSNDAKALKNIGTINVREGSHPVPTEKSIAAAHEIIDAITRLTKNDLYIYLLSGGSSALIEQPILPLTLDDMHAATEVLLKAGISIQEINAVRKHLSMVKGGRLAALTAAQGIVLVISDVIGDSLEVIGSAPCYCDKSSYQDCSNIIERYDLLDRLPERVMAVIKKGMAGEIAETPKKQRENVRHFVIGSNFKLLQKAKERAAEYGIPACIVSAQLNGEAREVAKVLTAIGKEIIATGNPFSKPVCLLCGGETTVTVTGNGKGGRNQEMCLAALLEIAGWDTIVFLSAGTDGIDGDSDAAGAVVDSSSYEKAEAQQLAASAYLKRNDSYSFFKQTGDLIQTGPTGTNVMDMTLMLVA